MEEPRPDRSPPALPAGPGPDAARDPAPPTTVAETLARATPHVWVTPLITAVLTLAFVAEALAGAHPLNPTTRQLLDVGASFGPALLDGEWWRLLSASLLHAGLLHLAFNLWALWSGGGLAERIHGNAGYAALYLLSALGAALVSVAVKPLSVSVGASGAIFGVYGALLTFALTHRGVVPPEALAKQRNGLLGFLGYNLVFALSQGNIDLASHAGGFVTGMVAGWLLRRDLVRPAEGRGRRALGAAALALALLAGAWGVRARVASTPEVRAVLTQREIGAAFRARETRRVVELTTAALGRSQDPEVRARLLRQRALAQGDLGHGDLADADLRESLRLHDDPAVQAELCEVGAAFTRAGDPRLLTVRVECDRALARDATLVDARRARAWVHFAQGDLAAAQADLDRLLQQVPNDRRGLGLRAQIRFDQRHLDAAEADCLALDRLPEPASGPVLCARLAWTRQRPEVARQRLERILAARPEDLDALMLSARLQQDAGDLDGALSTLDRAVALDPNQAATLDLRAWLHVRRREFEAARADADRGLGFVGLGEQERVGLLGSRCFAFVGLGELGAARRDCGAVLARSPGFLLERGMLAYLDGRRAEAVRAWEQAVKDEVATGPELEPWIARARGR